MEGIHRRDFEVKFFDGNCTTFPDQLLTEEIC